MQSTSHDIPDYILKEDNFKIDLKFNSSIIESNPAVTYKIQIEKTILIFGKTGAGKSAILNSITNRKFQIFKEGDTNFSETQKVKSVIHKLFNRDLSCMFIDSPGLFDSGNKDAQNVKAIADYVGKCGFSIILFAHSILDRRIDDSFHQTLETLIEIFGENVMGRVYFVFTHLNKINENLIPGRIKLIKTEFNHLVPKNQNELLFYDYNADKEFYGLQRLNQILKNYTTHFIPILKEEKLTLNVLYTKKKALELQKKSLVYQFEYDKNKYILACRNSEKDAKIKESLFNDELFKYRIKIQKELNENILKLEKKLTAFKFGREEEFDKFNAEKIESITNIQKEFVQLGGEFMTDRYIINFNSDVDKFYDLYKKIYSVPEELTFKLRNMNDSIKNKFSDINQELKKFKEIKLKEYKLIYEELNEKLSLFISHEQSILNLKRENLEILDLGVYSELEDIDHKIWDIDHEIKTIYLEKEKPSITITISNNLSNNCDLLIIKNIFYETSNNLQNSQSINYEPTKNISNKFSVSKNNLKATLINESTQLNSDDATLYFSDEYLIKKEINPIPMAKFLIKIKGSIEWAKSKSQHSQEIIDSYIVHQCECKWIRYGGKPSCNLCLIHDTNVNFINDYANYCRIDTYPIDSVCPKTGCYGAGTGGGWCANIQPNGSYCCGHYWWHKNRPCSIFNHSCTTIFSIKDYFDLQKLKSIIT